MEFSASHLVRKHIAPVHLHQNPSVIPAKTGIHAIFLDSRLRWHDDFHASLWQPNHGCPREPGPFCINMYHNHSVLQFFVFFAPHFLHGFPRLSRLSARIHK